MNHKTTIIPIASGKGGVGKSMFAANLAIALAKLGHSTVAIDLDLGGSNLHNYLGIPNKYPGIGDYLKGKSIAFKQLMVQTKWPDLRFIPGDGRTPFMANTSFEQRLVLLDDIQNISAQYVILDLGAGTTFNTLNLFGLSRKGAIVTTLDTPAIMNFLVFLRNFTFRTIASVVRQDQHIFEMLTQAFRQSIHAQPLTVRALLRKVAAVDSRLALRAEKICGGYSPRIIFNMGDTPDELDMVHQIDDAMHKSLSLEPVYFGFVFYDSRVRESAKKKKALLAAYPDSIAAQCIERIAGRLVKIWDKPVRDSAARLLEDTRKKYTLWGSSQK